MASEQILSARVTQELFDRFNVFVNQGAEPVRGARQEAIVKAIERAMTVCSKCEMRPPKNPAKPSLTDRSRKCQRVLDCLTLMPRTSYEIGRAIGESTNNVARRLKDLTDMGLVEDSGQRRKGERYLLTVWKVKGER